MTWFEDATKDRPSDEQRNKLLIQRKNLEEQILAMKALPLPKSIAAQQHRLEDMMALASKIKNIDKRLGRTST